MAGSRVTRSGDSQGGELRESCQLGSSFGDERNTIIGVLQALEKGIVGLACGFRIAHCRACASHPQVRESVHRQIGLDAAEILQLQELGHGLGWLARREVGQASEVDRPESTSLVGDRRFQQFDSSLRILLLQGR